MSEEKKTPSDKPMTRAEMPEAKAKSKKEAPKGGKTVKVKNVTKSRICLLNGILEPGAEGEATAAELSNLAGKYLEVI